MENLKKYICWPVLLVLMLNRGGVCFGNEPSLNVAPVAGSGNALLFNGVDDYVELGSGCMVISSWTLEFWIKPNSPDNYERIFLQGYNACNTKQIMAYWYNGGVQFTWNTDSSNAIPDISTTTITDGVWTHIAWTYNGSTHTVYVNGVNSSRSPGGNNVGTNGGNYIGRRGTSGNEWTGQIDEVRLWSYVRSTSQIAANRHKALNGTESYLVGYWRMDNNQGTQVRNYAGSNFQGTCKNMTDANWVASTAWKKHTTDDVTPVVHGAGYDEENASIIISALTSPINGTLSFNNSARTVTYTPNSGFNGTDLYTFQVDDGSLTDSYEIEIRVNKINAPYVTTHPKSDTANLGDIVSLVVAAEGNPAPTYQWQKYNGTWVDLSGKTDSILTFSGITAADSGRYRVRAENSAGYTISNEAQLWVNIAPTITLQPRDTIVSAGATASFIIEATGTFLHYQWYVSVDTTKTWNAIPGATSVSYSFSTLLTDNNKYFRCIVTGKTAADTSHAAIVTVVQKPVITSNFPVDTVMASASSLTLTAGAKGNPPPTFVWYHSHPDSSNADSIASGYELNLSSLAKNNNGAYFFIARNSQGSAVSDTIRLYVIDPVRITTDLPSSYSVCNGSSAQFHISVSGDDTIYYQWYENTTLLSGQSAQNYTIAKVDSAVHHKNSYYVITWNRFRGKLIGKDTSTVCTLRVSNYYNPFKMNVRAIDPKNPFRIQVKLYSNVNIADFPTTSSPFTPWADSLWMLYKTNGYPVDVSEAKTARFSIEKIKQVYPDTLFDTLLIPTPQQPNDSNYWFSQTVFWHDQVNGDTLVKPYTESGKLFIIDTVASENKLVINGRYIDKTELAWIVVDNISSLTTFRDSVVTVQCSNYPDFSVCITDTLLSASQLFAAGDRDSFMIGDLGLLPIEKHTLYCRWYVVGKNTSKSMSKSTQFPVGWQRPVYTGTLVADTLSRPDMVSLTWDNDNTDPDSMRIWWDTRPIPLTHNISLPKKQALYVPSSALNDTLEGLQGNTVYYFGLQIFKDMMWSVVTARASDTVQTPQWDTSVQVDNIIAVDTAWFNTKTNQIMVHWHIDLSQAPPGITFKSGYTVALGSALDTSVYPVHMQSVTHEIETTYVTIGDDIVFDTIYTAGLWLSGYSNQHGLGKPSYPTDSSTVSVPIPSFTWQYIKLGLEDTIGYAANRMIIIKKSSDFIFEDTVYAYHFNGDFPEGFEECGAVSIRFADKKPHIPPCMLGLRYKGWLADNTNSRYGMYRDSAGLLMVMHGFTKKNDVVWNQLTMQNYRYPYFVLADTRKPRTSVVDFNETVKAGVSVPTFFRISDNVANVQWTFLYGAGNTGYSFTTSGYFNATTDTSVLTTFISDTLGRILVSPVYGIRALFIVNDGIYAETTNVSRQVINPHTATFTANAHQWTPLQVSAVLDNSSLSSNFSNSITAPASWTYDQNRQRLFRYFSPDPSQQNSWIEYADKFQDQFAFIPARVIWCKTAQPFALAFGSGKTISLRKPYTVVLNAESWTDFALPFTFEVMLKDVLNASGQEVSDSIDIYHWTKTTTSFEPKDIYIARLDKNSDENDTLKAEQMNNCYTVYNYSSISKTLNFPPTCIALSKTLLRSADSQQDSDTTKKVWDISVLWGIKSIDTHTEKTTDQTYINRIRCGYDETGERETFYGPLPPSFGTICAGVYDSSSGTIAGYAIQHILSNGGLMFKIAFKNTGQQPQTIYYQTGDRKKIPKDFSARIYNHESARFENTASCMTLGAGESRYRWLLIGTDEYLETIIEDLKFYKLAFINAYPNPFSVAMKLHYSLPGNISEIRFILYDVKGRQIWNYLDTKHVKPGIHVITLPGIRRFGKTAAALSSGTYIIRMIAKNKNGAVVRVGDRKVTCIK